MFNDPSAPIRIIAELADELAQRGFASVSEAIGFAHKSADQQRAFFAAREPVSA